METYFKKSLKMIKILGINKQYEYQNLISNFLVLSIESLKYMSNKKTFKEIVDMAKEVE